MFAAIASGNPLQMSEEVPNSNGLQHTIVLSSTKPKNYSHISLFILPNVTFPLDFIATVYFKLGPNEDFRMFGYLSNEKPSAIFKVKLPNIKIGNSDDLGEIDMGDDDEDIMVPNPTDPMNGMNHNISELIIGISIEPRNEGMAKIQEWKQQQMSSRSSNSLVIARGNGMGVNTVGQLAKMYPVLTQELAGKIVQHAYNYLTGFLDANGSVSIKRFDGWWDKFKKRLANDASFLDEVTTN
ncbi:Protein OPI10 [Nakaseomyces bracarensis]|uniref:Protein OPI10 n=1 Tax=Nakaseomyces bracarensis TaxID=273131 RepID=A0ABR4NZ98_9SACH